MEPNDQSKVEESPNATPPAPQAVVMPAAHRNDFSIHGNDAPTTDAAAANAATDVPPPIATDAPAAEPPPAIASAPAAEPPPAEPIAPPRLRVAPPPPPSKVDAPAPINDQVALVRELCAAAADYARSSRTGVHVTITGEELARLYERRASRSSAAIARLDDIEKDLREKAGPGAELPSDLFQSTRDELADAADRDQFIALNLDPSASFTLHESELAAIFSPGHGRMIGGFGIGQARAPSPPAPAV